MNEIDLAKITEKTAIFIIGQDSINAIANIFINQMIQTVNIPFTFILDNFDSLKKLLNFEYLIKNASYLNQKVYVAIHNEIGFKEKYGKYIIDDFENIINLNGDIGSSKLPVDLDDIGNDNIYPELKFKKSNYFNFKTFIDNK